MITRIDVSQQIFAMDILKALTSSLKYHCKHVLRLLKLYEDKAVELELLRMRMDQMPLNTFPYIYKHREPFHVIKIS